MVNTSGRPPVAHSLPAHLYFRTGREICPITAMSSGFCAVIDDARTIVVPGETEVWAFEQPTSVIDLLVRPDDEVCVVPGEVWTGLLAGGKIARDGEKTYFWLQTNRGRTALSHASWVTKRAPGWFLGTVPEDALIGHMFDVGHRMMLPKIAILA